MKKYSKNVAKVLLVTIPYVILFVFFWKPRIFLEIRSDIKATKILILDKNFSSMKVAAKRVVDRMNELGEPLTPSSIRHFVHTNSIHQIDEEHDQMAWKTAMVLVRIVDCSYGLDEPPHLSCGPRAIALKGVYDVVGIKNRVVHIFSDAFNDIRGHTFLEVYCEEDKKWEIQDPDFDITYVNPLTNQTVSTLEIVLSPDIQAVPSSYGEIKIGWEANNLTILKDKYFTALKLDNHNKNLIEPGATVIVNQEHFNLKKKFLENNDYVFEKYCNKYFSPCHFITSESIK